jgi:hypothetical protein
MVQETSSPSQLLFGPGAQRKCVPTPRSFTCVCSEQGVMAVQSLPALLQLRPALVMEVVVVVAVVVVGVEITVVRVMVVPVVTVEAAVVVAVTVVPAVPVWKRACQ